MLRCLLLSFPLLLLTSCAQETQQGGLQAGEGYIDVEGGRVWFRINGSGTETPLLILHGGPGAPCYYLDRLAGLADERPVIFYDQLGAGRSEEPADTSLWHTERFVRELIQVREALGLDKVHILGHSWGTMLAVEYMLTNPKGVTSLILASPAISVKRWSEDAERLIATLPDSLQEAIEHHEGEGTTDSPEYQEAVMEYYHRFVCRSDPWPPEMDSTFAHFGETVYNQMWGPSEFTATGSLKTFERADVLPQLDLPVLFTAGRYDEATPETVEYYQSLVPGSKLVVFENSAHITMLDEPDAYNQAVRKFLREVEGRAE